MYTSKKRGPRHEPCGTSTLTQFHHNGEVFATGVLLSCSNHYNTLYLIVSVIHCGNSLTTCPFPLWMARSKLIIVLVIVFLNEYIYI